ncbi:MAG: rhodanese-like domain-containing protein [Thermodesulfobacteriota bacterium]|nr:rhodanese-like domain-containing protein [Thermodesulfobacteriota bacterium]
MKKRVLFVSVLAFVLTLALTVPTAIAKDMSAKDLVMEAKKSICEISVSDAKGFLDKGGYLFIDCREPKEFKMGHIPGAMNIPRGLMEFKIAKKVPDKTANIVVYCKKGGRGCLTTCCLFRMGYKNVKNMAGGWMGWEKAGYPIE